MPKSPYQLYQFNTNGYPTFQYLPSTNTPYGATPVTEQYAKDFITKNGLNQWGINGQSLSEKPGDNAWTAFLSQKNNAMNYKDIATAALSGKTTDSGSDTQSQPFQGFTGSSSDYPQPILKTNQTPTDGQNQGTSIDWHNKNSGIPQNQGTPTGSNDARDSNGLLVNPPGALYDRNTGAPLNAQNPSGTGNTSTSGQETQGGANSGQGQGGSHTYNTGNAANDSMLNALDAWMQRQSQAGTVINPNISIDPTHVAQFMTMAQNNLSEFLPYATGEIAPYYQSQLAQAKQSFLTSAGYSTQQQQLLEQDLQKTYNQSLKDIGSTAADQGFAQSGSRVKQETDLSYQTNRQIQQSRGALQNQTTQQAQKFASTFGGANVPQVNIGGAPEASSGNKFTVGTGSQPLYSLSDSVYQGLIGSQQYQQTADTNTRAGALSSAFQQSQGVQVPIDYSSVGTKT